MKRQMNENKRWIALLLLAAVLYISCSNSATNHANDKNVIKEYKDTLHRKPPSSFSDSISVGYPVAVFYQPDSLQLLKIKAITDTMVFESTMHELFYQMRNSRIVLKQYYPGIKITEVTNARYLIFNKAGGDKVRLDLNTKDDPCGLIIFDGKKSPQLVDMTNVDTELGFYFSK